MGFVICWPQPPARPLYTGEARVRLALPTVRVLVPTSIHMHEHRLILCTDSWTTCTSKHALLYSYCSRRKPCPGTSWSETLERGIHAGLHACMWVPYPAVLVRVPLQKRHAPACRPDQCPVRSLGRLRCHTARIGLLPFCRPPGRQAARVISVIWE